MDHYDFSIISKKISHLPFKLNILWDSSLALFSFFSSMKIIRIIQLYNTRIISFTLRSDYSFDNLL